MSSRGLFSRTALVCGLVFLYVPILSMIVFSFNNSRLVTVWDAAHSPTLKWYTELLSNGQIVGAAWLSIRIALISATGAVILGTLTGVALARLGPFKGRTLLSGMTTAPIVMPEVITGLSLLLMFVALEQLIGWPKGTGALTITLSHITFCMAYVTVVVQSRLVGFDESLEEAAMDLGATPFQAFRLVIIPYLLPAIISGALMSFTLSMDELIVTYFTYSPDSVTLPIKIFGEVKKGLNPMLNAISAIFIVATGVLVVVANSINRVKH